MGPDQAAITFFKSKEICPFPCRLESKDLLSDILKSGQNLDKPDIVAFGYGVRQIGGYNGLNEIAVVRKAADFLALADLIVCKQATGHIAGKYLVLS